MNSKNNRGINDYFNNSPSTFKTIRIAEVVHVGKLPVSNTDKVKQKINLIYNADPYIIKTRIHNTSYDNKINNNDDLPNSLPLLPRHLAIKPKVGELVMVFIVDDKEEKFGDRFYIGPINTNPTKLNKQTFLDGASSNFSGSIYDPQKDLSLIESIKGIYSEYDNDNTSSIDGRNNSDIVFKDSEILIRGGKFVEGNPKQFNQKNPSYIQIKNNFKLNEENSDETSSAINIVSSKINLISHRDDNPLFNLTKRDLKNNKTPYIDDEVMKEILENVHPLPFGDILLRYLISFRKAFQAHLHNKLGGAPPTDNVTQGDFVEEFSKLAPKLEKELLSKNINIY